MRAVAYEGGARSGMQTEAVEHDRDRDYHEEIFLWKNSWELPSQEQYRMITPGGFNRTR